MNVENNNLPKAALRGAFASYLLACVQPGSLSGVALGFLLPMNARSEKLLRLALCPAASQHESDAAALAFIRAARDGAETFESLFLQTKKRKVLLPVW